MSGTMANFFGSVRPSNNRLTVPTPTKLTKQPSVSSMFLANTSLLGSYRLGFARDAELI